MTPSTTTKTDMECPHDKQPCDFCSGQCVIEAAGVAPFDLFREIEQATKAFYPSADPDEPLAGES